MPADGARLAETRHQGGGNSPRKWHVFPLLAHPICHTLDLRSSSALVRPWLFISGKAGTMNKQCRAALWVLGFDGGCCICTGLAHKIVELSGGKLTARSLHEQEVQAWRERALGTDTPWLPALFQVNGDCVRAWTGPRMVWQLTRLLGIRRGWQLAGLLRELRAALNPDAIPDPARRRVLKGLSGAAVALLLASGKRAFSPLPAGAQEADEWTTQAPDPATYADMARRWNGVEYRAFSYHLVYNGWYPEDGGNPTFELVYRNGVLVRKVVRLGWYKPSDSSMSAQLIMSIEEDGVVYWHTGIRQNVDPVEELLLDTNGQVYSVTSEPEIEASAVYARPSSCSRCKAACGAIVARAGFSAGFSVCVGGCSSVCGPFFWACALPCGTICSGLFALGVGTLRQRGCTWACGQLGWC